MASSAPITTETVRGAPTGAPLAALGRAWERIERTERGYVYLSKLLPATLFFLLFTLPKIVGLASSLGQIADGDHGASRLLGTLYQAASLIFFSLVIALYLLRKRPMKRVAGLWQGIAALLGSFILIPVAFSGRVSEDPATLALANVLLIGGTLGAALSLASLGRCFGIFPEARGLVTHGLYRHVRHPMYLFEFIAFFGMLIPALTPLNVMLYAVFVWMQLTRMRFEEQMLSETFPDVYPAYSVRTARLVPGLY